MKPRGRPKKHRVITLNPQISQFSPRGKPGRPDEIELSLDEFEAIRQYGFLKKNQKEAAKQMQISQQTFSRIIRRAYNLVSDAIVNGKIIRIKES